ncbi:Tautomerase/MIF superfamily [Gongronella butleri]|nr:Tautomerase/MIF superfamily [Gongronella butleri]
MPIFEITTKEQPKDVPAFLKKLSVLFAEQIGKPESVCLVTYAKVDDIFFAGTNDAAYLAKVGSIGHIDEERNANLTKAVLAFLDEELGIGPARGYILFTDFPAANIGFNNTVFSTIFKNKD